MSGEVHVMLFEKVIDLIYGEYDPTSITPEEQAQYTASFRERMVKWKEDEAYRRIIGPLQPAHIFSRMAKVPVDVVQDIANDLELELPNDVDVSEFSLNSIPESEAEALWASLGDEPPQAADRILDALARAEEASQPPFQVVDLTNGPVTGYEDSSNVLAAVAYLEGIIKKLKAGEVHAMTLVALLNDGQASLWIPATIDENDVSDIYDPIIEALKNSGPMTNLN